MMSRAVSVGRNVQICTRFMPRARAAWTTRGTNRRRLRARCPAGPNGGSISGEQSQTLRAISGWLVPTVRPQRARREMTRRASERRGVRTPVFST